MKDGCKKVVLIAVAITALTAGNAAAICPVGDLDGDCEVGFGDLVLLAQQWLASTAGSADLTGDEQVDISDLGILAGNWRQVNLPLVINEVMASNTKTVKDPQGEYDDWIELFNAGDYAIDVGGMYLTDRPSNPTKWMIPDDSPGTTTVAARHFLQIWVDGDERDPGLHASFSLDADADDILLFDRDGRTLIDGFSFIDQRADISYGRYPEGGQNLRYMAFSTPKAANNGAYAGNVADTRFSQDRGFYDAPFSLIISTATEGAEIHYTTDGTAPSPASGLTYTGAIPISTTTCVRAMAHKPGWLQTNVDTHTYIFANDVIRQPANIPGYPNPWSWLGGNKYAYHDYEMDPVVVNDAAYSSMIVDSLKAIPTMSLVTGRAAMDTYYWGSGESPASIELIYPDDPNNSIQADCGVEPHSHNRLKRSLRLNFRAAYGDSKFKSDIFERAPASGDSARKSINKIILRGGNNRCWARVWNPDKTTYTMDQWFRDTQIAMSGVGSHGTFVHLYINGIYWGLYNPVERPDAAFAALYLGGEDDDYYSVSHGGSHGGSATRYNYLKSTLINKDMSDPDNYAEVQEYLNVESYIDYVMLSWFGGMGDWPGNNWWGANRNDPPEPFEYLLWDAEWSWQTTRGHNNGWVAPGFRRNDSGGPTIAAVWHGLRANGDFMMLFADRAYKHLFNDGVLTDRNCIERYLTLNNFIRDAIVAESARWGDSLITVGYPRRTRNVDWLAAEAETIGPGFMADNVAKFVDSLRNEGYYPNIDPPVFNVRGGPVASDFQMALSNPNSSGIVYYTLDGSDPRLSGGAVNTTHAIEYSGAITLNKSTCVKARVLSGSTWSALNQARFSVGPVAQSLRITEIMYHPQDTGDPGDPNAEFIELKNIGVQTINLDLVSFDKGVDFVFGNVELPAGRYVLVVKDQAAFETKYGQGLNVAGQYSGSLDNSGERIRLLDAAGQVIHDFRYEDDWYASTDGSGYSLVVIDPVNSTGQDWADVDTWRVSSSLGASPGIDD